MDEICSFYDNACEGDEGEAYIEVDEEQTGSRRYQFVTSEDDEDVIKTR